MSIDHRHPPTPQNHHLTPQDLAEREGVPLQTVYKWNCEGTGPRYLSIGRHVRYRIADVLSWENTRYAPNSGRHGAA